MRTGLITQAWRCQPTGTGLDSVGGCRIRQDARQKPKRTSHVPSNGLPSGRYVVGGDRVRLPGGGAIGVGHAHASGSNKNAVFAPCLYSELCSSIGPFSTPSRIWADQMQKWKAGIARHGWQRIGIPRLVLIGEAQSNITANSDGGP